MAGDLDQNNWKDALKAKMPQYFVGKRVLDIGSADMNGTNRPWFVSCEYVGIDVSKYKNVDVVTIAHEYDAPPASFDTIISTNQLEHDIHWKLTFKKMVELLKPNGLLIIQTCHDRGEHGTTTNNPHDSLTVNVEDLKWREFFKNYTKQEFELYLGFPDNFSKWEVSYEPKSDQRDIYFWGIKK